jgi:hypothetical protein
VLKIKIFFILEENVKGMMFAFSSILNSILLTECPTALLLRMIVFAPRLLPASKVKEGLVNQLV